MRLVAKIIAGRCDSGAVFSAKRLLFFLDTTSYYNTSSYLGIQFYVGWDAWRGYLVLPLAGEPDVRVRPVNGTGAVAAKADATWRKTATGYQMLISCDVGEQISRGQEFLVNLVVNEMLAERERRAGQLALVGGGGWVYLRGDRESAAVAAIAEVR